MVFWRQKLLRFRGITWLMAATVLMLALLPFHLHLHRAQSDARLIPQHTMAIHMAADMGQQDHHDNAVVKQAVPNALMAALDNIPLPAVILMAALALIAFVATHIVRLSFSKSRRRRQARYFQTPPLRAPPHAISA
jgi:hypothetical protein